MRVIAGSARRTLLVAPAGIHTRPTSDRAKEGLFNILGTQVQGSRFLDLYCGSGAIGIEALSRNAAEAVFAEQARPALEALKKNLTAAKLTDKAEILPLSAQDAINRLERQERRFDIIFLDPPYGNDLLSLTLPLLAKAAILEKDSLIIAETETTLPVPVIERLKLERQRDYGRTRFLFYRTEGATE
jgi:16S rRNA (guanine966-N2)-methyltransferase